MTITAEEIARGRVFFEQTRNGFVGATKDLSDAQGKFKPAAGVWSIAEIVEHLAIVQERLLGPAWQKLIQSPPSGDRDQTQVDSLAFYQISDRTA